MMDFEDLPDEVLEFILSLISPYQDLHECMAVSKRWRRCVQNVVKIRRRNFSRSISDFNVKWTSLTPPEGHPTISKRYSHSATIHDNSMYIFGGCTCSMTTFNDLWKFDLSNRTWMRPLATGVYPSPKACSSLVYYKNMLVLFGGWTYPPSYPLYQTWHLFNELHVYDIIGNHWRAVNTWNSPPPMAGHSVSVIKNVMIVFGGLVKPDSVIECEKTNDIWKLDLDEWLWTKQPVIGDKKPEGRFSQTQVVLNKNNIMIIGGSGGTNANYSDVWILNMTEKSGWKWIPVEIRGKPNRPLNIWSNPGCKVDNKIIVLNKIQADCIFPLNSARCAPEFGRNVPANFHLRIDSANRQPDLDRNVNGRWGSLRQPNRERDNLLDNNEVGPSNEENLVSNLLPRGVMPMPAVVEVEQACGGIRAEVLRTRQRTTNCFRRSHRVSKDKAKSPHFLGLYVLDLEHCLDEKPFVTWMTPKTFNKGPEETILYTLVKGKSEIVMFGGIQNDTKSLGQLNNTISNSLHFISARDYVI